ncbi:RloB family protein, partial [Microbispora hainanensis]
PFNAAKSWYSPRDGRRKSGDRRDRRLSRRSTATRRGGASSQGIRPSRAEARAWQSFDEYWCVFDVDEHHSLARAIELASLNSINIAVSNPCIDRYEAQDSAKALLGCDKVLTTRAWSN